LPTLRSHSHCGIFIELSRLPGNLILELWRSGVRKAQIIERLETALSSRSRRDPEFGFPRMRGSISIARRIREQTSPEGGCFSSGARRAAPTMASISTAGKFSRGKLKTSPCLGDRAGRKGGGEKGAAAASAAEGLGGCSWLAEGEA